jgi:hypothetical protein
VPPLPANAIKNAMFYYTRLSQAMSGGLTFCRLQIFR